MERGVAEMTKKRIYILHSPSWWPLPFGYDIFFGFVSGWILIILAKLIMASLLQRSENYYTRGGGGHIE